jgi:hypothetical protein
MTTRCKNGHDLSAPGPGRNRFGQCVQCERERDKDRKARKRARVAVGDSPRGILRGEGWTYSQAGWQWNKTTLETPGRLRAIAQFHADQPDIKDYPHVEFHSRAALAYLNGTGATDGKDYVWDPYIVKVF